MSDPPALTRTPPKNDGDYTGSLIQTNGRKDAQGRSLRLATKHDIPQICAISSSATKKFASIPTLADLAQDQEEPLTFQQWMSVGNIYVVEHEKTPVGFIAAHPLDNTIYVAEIAVHADHQGKGTGAILMNAVLKWAVDRATYEESKKARVTLTTYPDVPWNGPWYKKFGFAEAEAKVCGPWHVERMEKDDNEKRLMRPGYRRCCMLWESPTANAKG